MEGMRVYPSDDEEEVASEGETPEGQHECHTCRLRRLGVGFAVVEQSRKLVHNMADRQEKWLEKYGKGKRKTPSLEAREKLCRFWKDCRRQFGDIFGVDELPVKRRKVQQ